MLLHPFDNGMSVPAVRTLVVPVFHQGAFRIRTSLHVVLISNRHAQTHSFISCANFYFGSFSRASRIPSAPGFTATGELYRSDYGITANTVLPTGGVVVSDDIQLVLDVEASLRSS